MKIMTENIPNHLKIIEQNIKKQVTIADGSSGKVSLNIPQSADIWLKGYGYSYTNSTTYTLIVGNTKFPNRTDQEGSTTQPMIFATPPKANGGTKIELRITNNSGSSNTYEVVFYLTGNRLLDETSEGNELIMPMAGTGGVAGAVTIYNPAGSISADVVARGDGKNALVVDTEMEFHADNVSINNVKNASTDQTAGNVRYLKVDTNGRLDVRDLSSATDSVDVTATDLDIRDLDSASDSVEVFQATASNLKAEVEAIDLDIRDLDSTTDSVEVFQATGSNLKVTTDTKTSTATHTANSITANNTSEEALASNSNRTSAMIQNISDTAMYIKFGATAVDEEGIKLLPEASYTISSAEGNLDTRAINIICATLGKKYLVTEWA
jgi:hypothetical protein